MAMDSSVDYTPGLEFWFLPKPVRKMKIGFCKLEINQFLPFKTDNMLSHFLTCFYYIHSHIWAPGHVVLSDWIIITYFLFP